jgi:hypothetical protein
VSQLAFICAHSYTKRAKTKPPNSPLEATAQKKKRTDSKFSIYQTEKESDLKIRKKKRKEKQ